MYLSKIILENQGPIKEFKLDLDDSIRPVILVGENGTGKTILLSYIVDALYEFGKQEYKDLLGELSTDNYFRIMGGMNRKIGEKYSVAYLQFQDDKEYEYFESTGEFNKDEFVKKYSDINMSLGISNTSDNKKICTQDKETFKKIFKENSICYFMPNRFEKPHWVNKNVKEILPSFNLNFTFNNLLEKPIVIEETLEPNKQWILGVYLDSLVDVEKSENQYSIAQNQDMNNKDVFKDTRENVQKIIKEIVSDPNAILALNDRRNNGSRICIKNKKTDKVIIPSLDNFSTGQTVLFNLFCTIIRYADMGNVNNSIVLERIKGIVVIDEIDMHLHTNLQYNVLPRLIKLFPNVQFIISTHSPLFILGMEEEYKNEEDKPIIIEMPKDTQITAERFSEFINAYNCFTRTKKFEDDILEKIVEQKEKLKQSNKKAVLYVEGKTDVIHIKKAWKVLNDNKIMPFDIFSLDGADNIKQFLVSYSNDQIDKIVIGLLDYDWQGIKVIKDLNKNFELIAKDTYKRKMNNEIEKKAYIITIPTPNIDFSNYEYCPVEFLYEKSLLERYNMIEKRNLAELNQKYFKVNGDFLTAQQLNEKNDLCFYQVSEGNMSKNDFAKEISNNAELTKEDFKNFEPLFKLIDNIIENENEVKD